MKNIKTVKDVDIKKYSGTWYEIARMDHRFERNLVGVTATYTLKKDGSVKVENRGFKGSLTGPVSKITGRAKIPDKNNPGKLKVYFFLFFGADYLILDLDTDNYTYALVGSSSKNVLWILSRTPQMDAKVYKKLLNEAKSRGYDISKLQKVLQNTK